MILYSVKCISRLSLTYCVKVSVTGLIYAFVLLALESAITIVYNYIEPILACFPRIHPER